MSKIATAQITIKEQVGVYVSTITPPVALIPTDFDFTDPVYSSFEFLAELKEDDGYILPYLSFNETVFTYNRTTGIIKIKYLDPNPEETRFEYDFDFFKDSAKTEKVGTFRLILIKNAASTDSYTSILSNINESISCDSNGNPIGEILIPCETFGFFGTKQLTFTTGTPQKGQYTVSLVPENCEVSNLTPSGKFYVVGITADTARVDVNFKLGPVPHVEQKMTMSLNKTYAGDPGSDGEDGDDGPGVLFYGQWNNKTVYPVSLTTRAVTYIMAGVNKEYWMTPLRNDISYMPTDVKPGSTGSLWEPFGASFQSIATNLLLAENAHINMLDVGEGIWFGDGLRINNTEGIVHKDNGFQITPDGTFVSPYAGINGRITNLFVPRIYSGVSLPEAEQIIRNQDVPFEKYFVVDSNGKIYAQEASIKGVLEASVGSKLGILTVNENEVTVAGDNKNITITTDTVDSKFVDSPSYVLQGSSTPVQIVKNTTNTPTIINKSFDQTLYEINNINKGSYNIKCLMFIGNIQTVVKSTSGNIPSMAGSQIFYNIYFDVLKQSDNSVITSIPIYNYDAATFMFEGTGNITDDKNLNVTKTLTFSETAKLRIRAKGNYAVNTYKADENVLIDCYVKQYSNLPILKIDGINQQMIIGSDGIGVMVNAANYFKITQTPDGSGIRLQGSFPEWSADLPIGTLYLDNNKFLKVK